jgi:hypothetical protein
MKGRRYGSSEQVAQASTYTTHNTSIHVPSGIRPRNRAAADVSLSPHGTGIAPTDDILHAYLNSPLDGSGRLHAQDALRPPERTEQKQVWMLSRRKLVLS